MFARVWIAVVMLLVALAGILAAAIWYTRTRTNYTLGQAIWFLINRLVTRLLWRTKISGRLPVALGRGAVIVSNHRSGIDPLLIQVASDRVVHWMVAGEYWKYPAMRLVFDSLGAIPVGRRGIDTAATKQAIRLAEQGGLVGLFPEGRINTTPDLLLPGRPGAALIAIKARVPVIPIFIADAPYNGSALGPFLMTAKARVTIGEPIDLSPFFDRQKDRQVLADLTLCFLREIARLAGHPQFEPQLAGKDWHRDGQPQTEPDETSSEADEANVEHGSVGDE